MLESQFQDRSVCDYTVPSTHNVVDQWSGDGKISWRRNQLDGGEIFLDVEMLDARIESALTKININTSFKRRVSAEEQRAQKQNRLLRGRQIAYMIYDHFQASWAYDAAHGWGVWEPPPRCWVILKSGKITVEMRKGSKFRKCATLSTGKRENYVQTEKHSWIPWKRSRNELFEQKV